MVATQTALYIWRRCGLEVTTCTKRRTDPNESKHISCCLNIRIVYLFRHLFR